jgi:hypothetical protein
MDTHLALATQVGQVTFPGTSGPVGADGAPLVVYHGTKDDLTTFDLNHVNRKDKGWLGRGIHTTSRPDLAEVCADQKKGAAGDTILPMYVAVKDPYVASGAIKQRLNNASQEQIDRFTQSLKDQGHDGVAMEFDDGHIELVAFAASSQVKSATCNNGNFDSGKDDLRESAKRDPAVGDKTDISQLPPGKLVPASAGVGSLAQSRELARSKAYTKGRQLKEDNGAICRVVKETTSRCPT